MTSNSSLLSKIKRTRFNMFRKCYLRVEDGSCLWSARGSHTTGYGGCSLTMRLALAGTSCVYDVGAQLAARLDR